MEDKVIKEGLFKLPASPSERGCLIGSKCSSCGLVSFPKCVICPACFRDDTMEEIPLSSRGKLYTYCITQRAPEGFEAPYVMGYIDLPEKVRVFSLITGCAPSEGSLKLGMDMELVIERIRKDEAGNDLIGYKFKPVQD